MATTFSHHTHHVEVHFGGNITWDSTVELVQTLRTVVESYFYRDVELVIVSSGGGLLAATDHYLRSVERWRAEGVRVRTRVLDSAASAAVLLVQCADERVCEPGAALTLHAPAIELDGSVSERESARLHGALTRLSGDMVGRLVDRVLATNGPVAPGAEPGDRETLESLWAELAPRARRRPRSVEALARGVAQAVQRAVAERDRRVLARLLRRLCEDQRRLSAPLAHTLRLIDRIGHAGAAAGAPAGRPGLAVAQWRALFPPDGAVARELLTRHTLVLGETGSGKTASAVLPLVSALVNAPAKRLGAALVIDPKREIGPILARLAPARLDRLEVSALVLDLMAGSSWSLDADLGAGRWSTAAARILLRAASLVPSSPARVLGEHASGGANAEFFERQGVELALSALGVVLMLTRPGAPPPAKWLSRDRAAREWVEKLLARARGEGERRGPNALSLTAWAIETALAPPVDGLSLHAFAPDHDDDDHRTGWLFARIACAARAVWGERAGEGRDLLDRIGSYWAEQVRIGAQYAGVRASAANVCVDFAQPRVAQCLYFGCEPGYRAAPEACRFDPAHAVSRAAPGRIALFQPALDAQDTLVAKALKARFFESVLADPDRRTGDPALPLVAYVADEAHRFVTSDATHGEQSFLDTCRSYGAACVLACQSIASLEHALAQGDGSSDRNSAAVSILWTNSGNKLFFRSTDSRTAQRVSEVAPSRPGVADVTRVRPLSTLRPGECYAALADGRFERRQLEPFELEGELAPASTPGVKAPGRSSRAARRARARRRGAPHRGAP